MPAIVQPSSLGSAAPRRRVIVRRPSNTPDTAVQVVPLLSDKPRETVFTSAEVYRLPFIPWVKVRKHLLNLNPNLVIREGHKIAELVNAGYGHSNKFHIGVPYPPVGAVELWERLTHWEKRQVEAYSATDKPRVWSVAVAPGTISPFVTLVSEKTPGMRQEIISRSMRSILEKLVGDGAFTWDAAEREFGIAWRSYPQKIQQVETVRTRYWTEEKMDREIAATEDAVIAAQKAPQGRVSVILTGE